MVIAVKDRLVGLYGAEMLVGGALAACGAGLLQAQRLTKRYARDPTAAAAVRELDLSVRPGEFTVIMGRSGSGKSTLLYLLAALERPTTGAVWFAGQRIDQLDETALSLLRRRAMGFVFQAGHLVPHLSVLENLLVPAALVDRDRRAGEARARELLARVELTELAERLPAQLSGGEQQRVAIARAVINRPAVLFADEPTGALDSASSRRVLDLLAAIHAAGQTIVLVTHDVSVASQGERIVFLRDGAVDGELRIGNRAAAGCGSERELRGWLLERGW
jgi:putative ABC transport system ATP-binding protein